MVGSFWLFDLYIGSCIDLLNLMTMGQWWILNMVFRRVAFGRKVSICMTWLPLVLFEFFSTVNGT